MNAKAVLVELRTLGHTVAVRTDGKLSIRPGISRDKAARVREHKAEIVELLKREAASVEDRIVSELGGRLVGVSDDQTPLPPIWDGLTEAEKEAEMHTWCKRNGVSYPERPRAAARGRNRSLSGG